MKKFYSHLVEIESLTIELDSIELEDHEKHQLAHLIDSNIHNVVMDAILSKLPDSDKRKFAEIAHSQDHKKVWNFLKDRSGDIEDDIKKAANEFKKKLHQDLKEAKTKDA
jgi:hypothetical protein